MCRFEFVRFSLHLPYALVIVLSLKQLGTAVHQAHLSELTVWLLAAPEMMGNHLTTVTDFDPIGSKQTIWHMVF